MTDHMDVRIRDRYVQKGLVSRAEVEKYLTSLPDMTSNAESIDYEKIFESDDEDASDED